MSLSGRLGTGKSVTNTKLTKCTRFSWKSLEQSTCGCLVTPSVCLPETGNLPRLRPAKPPSKVGSFYFLFPPNSMEFFVDVVQMFVGDMRVDLRGGNVGVG